MSLLDDEDILITDNNSVMKELAKRKAKYLSYGFWCKKILEPAIKQINEGCCELDIYVSSTDIRDLTSCIRSTCSKFNISVCLIDCQNLNLLSDPALFIQHLPLCSIVILLNPSIMCDSIFKSKIKNILFNCWKDKETDVEQLLKDNNAGEYIIGNGNKKLHRGNYGIIYLDSEKNKDFNFHTLSGTECYGDFFIPGCNFTFMNTCYYDEVANIKELVDYGETFLNSRK